MTSAFGLATYQLIAPLAIAGRPATAVLVERLAALPWPELVLLARGLTGTLAEAAAAWRAAVHEETAERAGPQQGETRQGCQGEDGGEPGALRTTGQAHEHLTTPSSPPLQPLTEGSTAVTTSEVSCGLTPRPVGAPRAATEDVRAANTLSPEAGARPEDGRPSDDDVHVAEASERWAVFPAARLHEPSATVHHGLDHSEGHGSSRAPAPAAHHTSLPPACPQCGASNLWRVYGASSGRIACLSCQHHFFPADRAPSTPPPTDDVPHDAGASPPLIPRACR
jgi:hypothetical protein